MTTRSVSVISLGGTIAGAARPGEQGVAPTLTAKDLLGAVPGLAHTGIDVAAHSFRQLPGGSLGFADLRELSTVIEREIDAGADGVVITQGTDTIEETAFFLDLAVRREAPVVVTGAMRNPSLAGPDGPANLLAAIRVAADPAARAMGCLVVFADEIHAGRAVRKTHSTSLGAFRSPDTGPLGHVVEDVRFHHRVDRLPNIVVGSALDRLTVPVWSAVLGDDGTVLRLLADSVDGLVVAGFGAGHVPQVSVPALAELGARAPIVLASRVGGGPVLTRTYSAPGSEQDLLGRGLINAGYLDPYKARILLLLLLSQQSSAAEIDRAFAPYRPTH